MRPRPFAIAALLALLLCGQAAGLMHRLDADAHQGATVCHECLAYTAGDDAGCDTGAPAARPAASILDAINRVEPRGHRPVAPLSARGPPTTRLS
jgi:hypothetical protein